MSSMKSLFAELGVHELRSELRAAGLGPPLLPQRGGPYCPAYCPINPGALGRPWGGNRAPLGKPWGNKAVPVPDALRHKRGDWGNSGAIGPPPGGNSGAIVGQ